MSKNKRDLLVTAVDANFIEQAKQLFSSAHHKGAWQGDYMILSDNLSEDQKAIFKEKGILVFCPPLLSEEKFGHWNYPPLLFSKLYLFHPYFKKWRSIVFLDADIIIRASFSALAELPGFNAHEAVGISLRGEFKPGAKSALLKKHNLNSKAFSTGVMAFNTDIINTDMLPKMLNLLRDHKEDFLFGEEALLNLFFYKKWQALSSLYNYIPSYMKEFYNLSDRNFSAPITHFMCEAKPWNNDHPNFLEWSDNLQRFKDFNLSEPKSPLKIWSDEEFKHYEKMLNSKKYKRVLFLYLDRQIGKMGLLLKKISPSLYEKIKLKK